jgi:hypothetical protein
MLFQFCGCHCVSKSSVHVAQSFAAVALAVSDADPVAAHAISSVRVFPVTLTLDDPGVADEVTVSQVVYQQGSGPGNDTSYLWEWDKTITPDTALIYNHGYDVINVTASKKQTGFANVVLTGKWKAWVVPEHEFLVSLGVQREFAGDSHAVANGIADARGSTGPTAYFGKGLGDLPLPGMLRPLAITGEFTYTIPDRRLNTTGNNGGTVPSFFTGLSLQYSMPHLQSQVKDYGLPDFVNRLVPLVEMNYSTPTAAPAFGDPMTLSFSAGAIYLAGTYQIGLELVIPRNKAADKNVGYIAQLHLFLDDILPDSLGKPLFL